jgi:hypothetical protein
MESLFDKISNISSPTSIGARPKGMENTPMKLLDVLLLGNHLRRLSRVSKPSQMLGPT